jgi:hypothetical protein
MESFYEEENIDNLINGEKYDIPTNIKQIKIDVGLAGEAPNSSIWLSETDDRYVFGIEPLPHHWSMLTDFKKADTNRPYPDNFKILQLHNKTIEFQHSVVCDITNRFSGLRCAIDNVDKVTTSKFYEMNRDGGASGASSLLEPSSQHPTTLNDILYVKTISLEMLLDKIPWNRFEYIEHIKTDCESKDFDVVKSIGKYLDRIVFITSEMTNNTHHVIGACDPNAFIEFMRNNDFSVIKISGGNIEFVNNKLKHKIEEDKLNNKTLGI